LSGPGGRLLVCGGLLIDDLTFADGRRLPRVLGGAALYALAGAALWHDDVVLVSGAGQDAQDHVLPWMARAGLSAERLRIEGPHTPRNDLVYRPDGTRTETQLFGPAHFERLQPSAADIARALPTGGGAYVFQGAAPGFWAEVGAAARAQGAVLLWEIAGDACTAAALPQVRQAAAEVDALSINLEEAQGLFGPGPVSALVEALRGLGAPIVFLRCGEHGSLALTVDSAAQIPAVAGEVVDVTGAGNAYGGAALAGLAGGADAAKAGLMGAIAAGLAIAQHGPFEPRDPGRRHAAWTRLDG
jgi:sugar/nucleoside kinase (ribokinase family)